MTTVERKIKMGRRGGLGENPIGLHVSFHSRERHLLGEVTGYFYSDTLGQVLLEVRHFNGEPWPIEPTFTAVNVIG